MAAKVPDDKARAAAVEVAAFEKPLPDFSQLVTRVELATLATKADLAALATKAELVAFRAELRAEIVEAKNEILKWVFALILGSTLVNVGTVIAAVRLPGSAH